MPSTIIDYTADNTAPAAISPGDFTPAGGGAAPIGLDPVTDQAPGVISPGDFTATGVAAVPIIFAGGPAPLPTMQSSSTPAFVGLTGGGNTLASLTANGADAAAGRIITGIVDGELKNYQIRVGVDEQALPGIVRLSNFDAVENPVVAVSC